MLCCYIENLKMSAGPFKLGYLACERRVWRDVNWFASYDELVLSWRESISTSVWGCPLLHRDCVRIAMGKGRHIRGREISEDQ